MRFLVTGGNGQLGKEWFDYLQKQDAEYKAFSSSELDITDSIVVEQQLKTYKPDVIINCAAYTKVDQAEDEQEKAYLVNARGVEILATQCALRDIKLLHYSTDYIFAGTESDHQEFSNGYAEDHPTQPLNVYGASKLAGEEAMQESGCDYLLIRVSWLCGKYGNNFVKTMLKLAKDREELKVVNDQHGSPTFARNVVENSYHLLQQKKTGIFHLSSIGKINWYEFACEVFRFKNIDIMVFPVDSSQFPTKAKRPAFSLLSTQKIANIPRVSLVDWKSGLHSLLNEIN